MIWQPNSPTFVVAIIPMCFFHVLVTVFQSHPFSVAFAVSFREGIPYDL